MKSDYIFVLRLSNTTRVFDTFRYGGLSERVSFDSDFQADNYSIRFQVCEELYLSISLLASGYNSPFDRCCTFNLCGSFFTADLCVFQNKHIFGSGGASRGLEKRRSASL